MFIDHPFEGLSHRQVEGTGPQPCRLLFIGESPGHEEDETGRAFCGKTGRELDNFYLKRAALRRREVRVNNLIVCHPYANRNPTTDEIHFFEEYLTREIQETNPEIIVPMGAFATKYFLGYQTDLHTVHGLPHTSKKWPDVTILPSYHPAAGLHNTETQALIVYDFEQIQLAVQGVLPDRPQDEFPDPIYEELKTRAEVFQSLDGCNSVLMGSDTEGYANFPWGLSYSIHPGVSYVIRIQSPEALQAFAEWIAAHPEVVVILHNALHDLAIYRDMGIEIKNFEDTMVYSYVLCLEPQGLKDLAYRHCGMKMKSYDETISPALRKVVGQHLIKVAKGDWGLDPAVPECESAKDIKWRQPTALHKRALRAVNDIYGRWTGVVIGDKRGGASKLRELGVNVGTVNKEAADGLPKTMNAWNVEVGIPILDRLDPLWGEFIWELQEPVPPADPPDPVKRWDMMGEDLEESVARCEAAIGTPPIVGLDALEDQQVAVNYSARDAHATLAIRSKLRAKVEANGLLDLAMLDMSVLPYVARMKSVGIKVNRQHMLDYGEVLKNEMRELQEQIEKEIGMWINPSSSQQVGLVVYDILGCPVQVRTETGLPSTADKVLEGMATLHPVIQMITDFRELHKLRSTYALKLPRWMDAEGRCHPTWKVTRVASGRVATADPNLLAIPTRSEKGKKIRAGFIPESGHVFLSCDLSQIEVRVAAHYSRDPNLMQIFLATSGVDFHTQTAMAMWHLSADEIKKDDEEKGGASMRSSAKNVSFGVLYGISSKGLQAQLKSKCHTDWTEEQCQEMINLWLETAYPQVKWYMEKQKHFCRTHGYVESLYGRRRYLPGVHSTVPRIREEANRACINHPIQSSAAEILKIAECNIWNRVLPIFWEAGVYVEPILAVHDELIFEIDADAAEEVKHAVIWEMEHALELCVPVVSKGKISAESWAGIK